MSTNAVAQSRCGLYDEGTAAALGRWVRTGCRYGALLGALFGGAIALPLAPVGMIVGAVPGAISGLAVGLVVGLVLLASRPATAWDKAIRAAATAAVVQFVIELALFRSDLLGWSDWLIAVGAPAGLAMLGAAIASRSLPPEVAAA